ncbi:hypothetical protein [Fusobacterium nucleatum]|jgi:hypothetical protein|uniref:hypothetical protein n=1 Tax=Fusobacterium nucleatum TaxID=851 RepID=UPI0030CC5B43
MAIRNKKDIEIFYKKALTKILSFRADELTLEEFTQVKRYAEKLEVYRFVRRNNEKRKCIRDRNSRNF